MLMTGTHAFAQYLDPLPSRFPRDRNIDVDEMPVPGLQSPGIPLGAFTLRPSIAASAIYSDNIFAQETAKKDDLAVRIAPAVRLQSNGTVNRMALNLGGQFDRFSKLTSENADRFDADLSAVSQVTGNTLIRSRLRWQQLQEARSSQNVFTLTREPLKYDMAIASIGIVQDLNRVRLSGEASAIKTDYHNGLLDNGSVFDTRSRDSDTISLRGRLEYAQLPGLSYFLQGTYNSRNFRTAGVPSAERDSDGYEILSGVSFEPSPLMRGEIGLGFLAQNFKRPLYHDNANLGIRGRIDYFPTRLTTISLEADRQVEDTGTPQSGAYLSTSFSLKAKHALLRSLILTANADYQTDHFNDIDRNDDRYAFGLRAEYRLNPMLALSANVAHLNVSSAGIDRYRTYSESRLLAGISIRR